MADLNDSTIKTELKTKDKWKGSKLPKFVTLTGLENLNDVEVLHALSEKYPVEWGVCPKSSAGKGVAQWDVAAELIDGFIQNDCKFAVMLSMKEANEFIMNPTSIGLPYPRMTKIDCRIFIDTEAVFNYRALASRIERNISKSCRMVILSQSFPLKSDPAFDCLYRPSANEKFTAPSDKDCFVGYNGAVMTNVVSTIRSIKAANYWLQFEIPYNNGRIDFQKVETLLNRIYG